MTMNLFTRIKQSIEADVHEALDKKENRNPLAALNQYLRQCEQEVEKVRKLVERQFILKEQFQKELKEARYMMEKRSSQAQIASEAGESELFTFADQESENYRSRVLHLEDAVAKVSNELTELEHCYELMKHKLKDMSIKQMELMGKENLTHAHYRMNKVLNEKVTGLKEYDRFEQMEGYLTRLEEKINRNYHENTIDAKIEELQRNAKKEESKSL
ncbi:modulator protein [Bacillus coahuilensis m2-6]|nr:modulator protein [Bacillus coahuilensis m2-6]